MVNYLETILGLFLLAIGTFFAFKSEAVFAMMSRTNRIYGFQTKRVPGTRFTFFKTIGVCFMLIGIYLLISSIFNY
jgi:hypothetical protein